MKVSSNDKVVHFQEKKTASSHLLQFNLIVIKIAVSNPECTKTSHQNVYDFNYRIWCALV